MIGIDPNRSERAGFARNETVHIEISKKTDDVPSFLMLFSHQRIQDVVYSHSYTHFNLYFKYGYDRLVTIVGFYI